MEAYKHGKYYVQPGDVLVWLRNGKVRLLCNWMEGGDSSLPLSCNTTSDDTALMDPAGSRLNVEELSYQDKNYHYKDKTVMRPSYLYNGNSYPGKTAFSYWDNPQITNYRQCLFDWHYSAVLPVKQSCLKHSSHRKEIASTISILNRTHVHCTDFTSVFFRRSPGTVGQRKKVTAVTFFRCPNVLWSVFYPWQCIGRKRPRLVYGGGSMNVFCFRRWISNELMLKIGPSDTGPERKDR